MVINNVNQEVGIFNSKRGILRGFVYEQDVLPPELPLAAIVEFTDLSLIPEHLHFDNRKNYALIHAITLPAD